MDRFHNNNSRAIRSNSRTSSSSNQFNYDPSFMAGGPLYRPFTNPSFGPQLFQPLVIDPTIRSRADVVPGRFHPIPRRPYDSILDPVCPNNPSALPLLPPQTDVMPYSLLSAIDSGRFHSRPVQNYRYANFTPCGSSTQFNVAQPARSPPVKMEDDNVVMMDGVLVSSSVPGSSSASSYLKSINCRFWEANGNCSHGANCFYKHGNEELRPGRKGKVEGQICKSFTTGICTRGNKCRFLHQLDPTTTSINPNIGDWSPADDGIQVSLPNQELPSRADVNAYIAKVLHGPPSKPRLPVFTKFCPD